jgi:hypothetical protein
MSAEEQSDESKDQQEKNWHVSDSSHPSHAGQPVTSGSNIGEPQGRFFASAAEVRGLIRLSIAKPTTLEGWVSRSST